MLMKSKKHFGRKDEQFEEFRSFTDFFLHMLGYKTELVQKGTETANLTELKTLLLTYEDSVQN